MVVHTCLRNMSLSLPFVDDLLSRCVLSVSVFGLGGEGSTQLHRNGTRLSPRYMVEQRPIQPSDILHRYRYEQ